MVMFWSFEHDFFSVPVALALSAATAAVMFVVLRARRDVIPWISGIAVVVPWLVGLAVKAWLMAKGKPTWPALWILRALPLLVPATILLALPLIVFAVLAQRFVMNRPFLGLASRDARSWLVAGVVVGSVANMTLVFSEVFWQFDPIVILLTPLVWKDYAPGAVLGAVAGWVAGRLLDSPPRSS